MIGIRSFNSVVQCHQNFYHCEKKRDWRTVSPMQGSFFRSSVPFDTKGSGDTWLSPFILFVFSPHFDFISFSFRKIFRSSPLFESAIFLDDLLVFLFLKESSTFRWSFVLLNSVSWVSLLHNFTFPQPCWTATLFFESQFRFLLILNLSSFRGFHDLPPLHFLHALDSSLLELLMVACCLLFVLLVLLLEELLVLSL